MDIYEHLKWIYDRLIMVHGENKYFDYMHRLKKIIDELEENDIGSKSPLSEYDGDLMTIKDFIEYCDDGMITDDDGFGYYCDDEYCYPDVELYYYTQPENKKFTHVMWFNK